MRISTWHNRISTQTEREGERERKEHHRHIQSCTTNRNREDAVQEDPSLKRAIESEKESAEVTILLNRSGSSLGSRWIRIPHWMPDRTAPHARKGSVDLYGYKSNVCLDLWVLQRVMWIISDAALKNKCVNISRISYYSSPAWPSLWIHTVHP